MKNQLSLSLSICMLATLLFASCSQDETQEMTTLTWQTVQDSTARVQSISGFSGPEAVRYDPGQDVYFVSNFTGGGNDRDENGFISKVTPDGTIDELEFITGTDEHPLHAPRGMYITADILWAADIDGIHGFNRMTGDQVDFVDFTEFEPGFLNDIAAGSDGNLYVTDTGQSRLYQIQEGNVSIVEGSLPHPPNGITLDPASHQLVLAPWNEALTFYAWDPSEESLNEFTQAGSGGNFDGIEFLNGRMLAASQVDSSLHVIENGSDFLLIHTPGRPADIGLDTQRNQVAVPYIDLNRVDIWQLPEE
ncbi:MAG: hypothetical protein WD035_11480 [Balneolaceae bacterium]